jgi:hypothetical protein
MKLSLTFFNFYFRPLRKRWPLLLIGALFICFVLYMGYLKGYIHPIMRDFYGFWKAGWDFTHGCDLYIRLGYSPQFYYPSFAAMVFVLFSLMSYGTASFVMYIINVLLLFFITELVLRLSNEFGYDNEKMRWPLFLSLALSFRFYWATLDLFQVNAIVFTFSLMGILAVLKHKNYQAATMFVLATFFKVIPAVFIIWLLVRRFSWKLFAFIIGLAVFLFIVPVPFRGIDQGIADIDHFFALMYQVFTHMLNNNVYINQSMAASVMRLLTDTSEVNATNVHLFYLSFQTARIITTTICLLTFSYFIWLMARLIRKANDPSIIEICLIFLAAHLFSVFTWKAHMVTMAFVYVPLFLQSFRRARFHEKALLIILYILIIICAFSGRALLRPNLHVLIASLNIFFYVIFVLFVYYCIIAERNLKKIHLNQKQII